MPTVPVIAAGWRIEPPVSVAVAARHRSAATAAEEPPEEPPGTSSSFVPLRAPRDDDRAEALVSFDEPMANSSQLSLPSITAPASHRFCVDRQFVGRRETRRGCWSRRSCARPWCSRGP